MSQVGGGAVASMAGEFRVGRVLGQSFTVFMRDIAKFFLVALIAILPSILLMLVVGLRTASLGTAAPNLSGSRPLTILVFFLITILCYPLSQAITLYGAFQDMRGRPFLLGEAVSRAFARLLPLIGVAICWGVAVMVGSLLLIVPGMMMLAAFYVALPSCVVEATGPIESLSRSAALTKGHRWRVFGIFVVIALVSSLVGFLLQVIAVAMGGLVTGAVIGFVWNALYTAFNSVVISVMYYDLRVAKEGIDIDRIAAVFD